MKALLIAAATLLLGLQASIAQEPDALDEALALVNMKRQDLGWQPKGWWPQYPADIPYKLRAFDSLFERPLETVTFTRLLGHVARSHLNPETLDKEMRRGSTHLFEAVHNLGINPKCGSLRGYATNLTAEPTKLDEAILVLHRAAGRPTRPFVFQDELPYPKMGEELAEKTAEIPEEISRVLGQLVLNVVDAHEWAERAFRNVDGNKRAIVALRYNLGSEQVDGYDYCPACEDVARTLDEPSLWYAGEKCVQALDNARLALAKIENPPAFVFDWRTPWGWIRIRGSGDDEIDGDDALLVVDLGGNDVYRGGLAASTATRAIGLALDLAGDDVYEADEPAQGVGVCGIGVLLDVDGDDQYRGQDLAQGMGQFGLGVCADLHGDDWYGAKLSAQGCGYFGVGLLLDCAGDDDYRIYGDGQGLGGVGGVGVLADRSGDDTYEAVRDSKITKRPSYHSPNEDVSVSNAQGCGVGRRGDGGDGHAWAGGLGALLDVEGNDEYISGNWSQGCGYWFGTGLLYDGTGDDKYRGVCWSQAAGAHFCIGVLVDEGGDDRHVSETETSSHTSIAFAHDFTAALLVNIGGNDEYKLAGDGVCYSINRSVAMLIDIGGDDRYTGEEGNRPGMAVPDGRGSFDAGDATQPPANFYFADATSIGLFLDVGGTDTYWTGQENNSHWLDEPDSPNWKTRNYSVGVDREDGTVHFVPIPTKPVPAAAPPTPQ